jgi:hypothetical protein
MQARVRQIELREWWLWAFAVTVTLALTLGIVSLTYFGDRALDDSQWLELAQGYFFARPCSGEAIDKILAAAWRKEILPVGTEA